MIALLPLLRYLITITLHYRHSLRYRFHTPRYLVAYVVVVVPLHLTVVKLHLPFLRLPLIRSDLTITFAVVIYYPRSRFALPLVIVRSRYITCLYAITG